MHNRSSLSMTRHGVSVHLRFLVAGWCSTQDFLAADEVVAACATTTRASRRLARAAAVRHLQLQQVRTALTHLLQDTAGHCTASVRFRLLSDGFDDVHMMGQVEVTGHMTGQLTLEGATCRLK